MRLADVSPNPLKRDLGAGYDVTIPLPGCRDDQIAMRRRNALAVTLRAHLVCLGRRPRVCFFWTSLTASSA
jgi:hypothetical protein